MCGKVLLRFVLPFGSLCAQINVIGGNQILEILVLARFSLTSLAKCIQQREAAIQLPSCSTSAINAKFE